DYSRKSVRQERDSPRERSADLAVMDFAAAMCTPRMEWMKVTVLYGGPSAERENSLISGKAVIAGLRSMGHEVFASDISPADLRALDVEADVIFPVLHGAFGESGELQE